MSILLTVVGPDPGQVMEGTWGHLAPEPRRRYDGAIVFAVSYYTGQGSMIVDVDFPGLPSSPWFYEALCDWLDDQEQPEGAVYRFTGSYMRYRNGSSKFTGSIKRVTA